MSWPSWPTSSPTASTPTATSATSTGPDGAASPSASKISTACRPISGYLTPEARATLDAVFAKLAAPGMCNSADDDALRQRHPSQAAIQGDTRSAGQRNHDALLAAGRALLASGELGQHNGLPASIIVTTTLQELEAGAGESADRRRHPAADVRRDPAGLPCAPLPRDLRQGQSAGAVSHQTPGLTGPANCVVRQRPRVFVPRLRRARATSAKSTTATPTPPTPSPTSTT